jgi:hypothetical protein
VNPSVVAGSGGKNMQKRRIANLFLLKRISKQQFVKKNRMLFFKLISYTNKNTIALYPVLESKP